MALALWFGCLRLSGHLTLMFVRISAWPCSPRVGNGRVRAEHEAFMRGVLSAVPTQEGIVLISLARGVKVVYVRRDVLKGEAVP